MKGYRTLVFDCDGVILDSNRVKTEAFRTAALPWGEEAAEALVAHHVAAGGISRYEKFSYFLDQIIPRYAPGREGPGLDALLSAYAGAVREGLMSCEVAEGLGALRAATPEAQWMIVSGGDQAELRSLFANRDIAGFFDGGIFGSPDSKDTILSRESAAGSIRHPALFIGDSRYDHIAASRAGLDFVFVHSWTEMPDWQDYMARHGIVTTPRVADLLAPKT